MYLIYSALLAVGLVVATPFWLLEMVRHGKYRKGLSQRLGIVPQSLRNPGAPSIWIHAVSVGEVLAVSELVRKLRSEFPKHRVLVSTTTDTGQELARKRFGAGNVFYFPLDFAFIMRRYFAAIRPELVVVAETEFWPNFLKAANQSGADTVVVNARISDRSLPGYRRWKRLLRPVLSKVAAFLAQSPEDARRLIAIGAAEGNVFVAGNLKYDFTLPPPPAIVSQLKASLTQSGAGPVLVCGSTVDGEEPLLADVFHQVLELFPNSVMLLAPRRPERFGEVAVLLQEAGLKFEHRTQWNGSSLNGSVLLIDSIGELASLYALSDIAVVGGSFVPAGGHNILEPAHHGVPILVGPHMENFREIVALFRANDAVGVVLPQELGTTITTLLREPDDMRAVGQRALQTLQAQRGGTAVTLEKLKALLSLREPEAHTT